MHSYSEQCHVHVFTFKAIEGKHLIHEPQN